MASLTGVARRVSARLIRNRINARGFKSSTQCHAAQNFVMPALSPTMTEGNIATWKVKEGDSYSAGDVLLEIETDKATMDVEAQDDGIMMKIMAQDGAKSVQVGTRIAVLAEAGDDIKTLEMPADEKPQQTNDSSGAAPKPNDGSSAQESRSSSESGRAARTSASEGTYEHKHPLMPSVETLLHQKGLSKDEVGKIRPTGPNGRLLKGDVLAFLGSIDSDRPAAISSMFEKLSHLDLSNIKVAEKKREAVSAGSGEAKAGADTGRAAAQKAAMEVQLPISLTKVVDMQRRIQETLGVFMPLSTFISRAAQVANDNLPPSRRAPTASQLFDQVLGLDKIKSPSTTTRGVYLPQISAVTPRTLSGPTPRRLTTKADIIDDLASKSSSKKTLADATTTTTTTTVPGLSSRLNLFSLVVPRDEEQRAHLFLERCRIILEEEPGRLVL